MSDIAAGVLVVLNKPYKPSVPDNQLLYAVAAGQIVPGYRSWHGFTHGIVVYIEDGGDTLVLALYDPVNGALYIDHSRNIPVRVQFHVSEVALLQKAGDFER